MAASLAQVYSANVVGYVNVTVPSSGFVIIANQLKASGGDSLTNVIKSASANLTTLKWSTSLGQFLQYEYDTTVGWYDPNSGELLDGTVTLKLGEAAFIRNGDGVTGAQTITFVGDVTTTNSANAADLNVPLPSGFSLVSAPIPLSTGITNSPLQFPGVDLAAYLRWDGTLQQYVEYDYSVDLASWYDPNIGELVNPTPAVGEGFFFNNPGGPITWSVKFGIQ